MYNLQGMLDDEVKKIKEYLESCIRTEVKIDFSLNEIRSDVEEAYKSSENSLRLNNNNKNISNSEYIKVKNLKSYKNYIDKCIHNYVKTSEKAVDILDQTAYSLENKER